MLPMVLERCRDLGYVTFARDDKPYNLNIVGIRTKDNVSNTFNDALWVGWKFLGAWQSRLYPITTDPGVYYRENPINVNGTAILKPGQYRSSHMIGLHRGKYTALVQKSPVTVWRDNNKDTVLDYNVPVNTGDFGINIHRASSTSTSTKVDRWSAGCQVFADPKHFDEFIQLCTLARSYWGNSFTYTLIEE